MNKIFFLTAICGRRIVQSVLDRGYTYEIDVQTGETQFRSLITRSALVEIDIRAGQDIYISFKATAVHCF